MNGILPLPIFPEGSLSHSVVTTVWVGLFVVCIFNLRFGWLLAGLVIPGYLVPLMIAKPVAAFIVVGEGCLTYFLVWLFSERFSGPSTWSSFFGRDRFTALVLSSVVVRLVFDGFLLPRVGAFMSAHLNIPFDYQGNLHSYGLILVALIANQFWKPGLRRGIIPFLSVLFITYVLVRFVLMELTNFSISNLAYMYEDLASSILASPKAYIILITTALIASRMNLVYGWDYNGILIPGLLALQWFEPSKILTSFVETFIILGCARLVLRLPVFRGITMEGARKLLLFFNVSFAYRMVIGFLLPHVFPLLSPSDLFGLGYLLPTLMAIKIYDKGGATRFTFAALRTSLIGVAAASVIGFSITMIPLPFEQSVETDLAGVSAAPLVRAGSIADIIYADKVHLFQGVVPETYIPPGPQDLQIFEQACLLLRIYAEAGDRDVLARASAKLASLDYVTEEVGGKYLYIHETAPYRGWGSYVLNLSTESGLHVSVPVPLDEGRAMEAGVSLFVSLEARSCAIGGTSRANRRDGSSDPLGSRISMLREFQSVFGVDGTMQVRGGEGQSSDGLYVHNRLPDDLVLGAVRGLVPDCELLWRRHPGRNVLRDDARRGWVELWLQPRSMRRLIYAPLAADAKPDEVTSGITIDGYLMEWLVGNKTSIAARGSEKYRICSLQDLMFFDQEILSPLISLAAVWRRDDAPGDGTFLDGLIPIASACRTVGYELIHYRHLFSKREYILLREDMSSGDSKYWGTYVLRLGDLPAPEFIVQVPRPLYEKNTFEYGVALFERMQCRWLLIGGAHPKANADGTADLIQPANGRNLFNLVHQVVLREARETAMLSVQCRAFGERPGIAFPESQIVMGFNEGLVDPEALSPGTRKLIDQLEADGMTIRFADGGEDVAGYEVGGVPQSLHIEAAENKDFVLLWLSPLTRQVFRQQAVNRLQQQQFESLGIKSVTGDLYESLAERWPGRRTDGASAAMRRHVSRYLETQDIVALSALKLGYPDCVMQRFIDRNTQQAFLVVAGSDGGLMLVANLVPLEYTRSLEVSGELTRDQVDTFSHSRAGWLDWGAGQ